MSNGRYKMGGMTLVKRTIVTSTVTSIEIASGLDGDADGGYTVVSNYVDAGGGGAPDCLILPNNISATFARAWNECVGGANFAGSGAVGGFYVTSCSNGTAFSAVSHIFPKTGGRRRMASMASMDATAATSQVTTASTLWTDTSVVITSLVVTVGSARMAAGSEFLVYRWT